MRIATDFGKRDACRRYSVVKWVVAEQDSAAALALAETIGATVITADARLLMKCAGTRFAGLVEPLVS